MSNGAHSQNTTQDTGYTTSRVLDDIKTATDCISHATMLISEGSLSHCTEDPYLGFVVNTFSDYLRNQNGYGGRSNCFLQ